MQPILLSSREAAKALSISTRTLDRMRRAGDIPCVRLGHSLRYALADLERLVASNRQGEFADGQHQHGQSGPTLDSIFEPDE